MRVSPADDIEFYKCWSATERLIDGVTIDDGAHRAENVCICAHRISLMMRDYIRSTSITHNVMKGGRAVRERLPIPQSDIVAIKRARAALAQDNFDAFRSAIQEVPRTTHDRLLVLSRPRSHDPDDDIHIGDPWIMLLLGYGRDAAWYGKKIPAKDECLRVIDLAIAELAKPGRRPDHQRRELAAEITASWARMTGNDLRQPSYVAGSSNRAGPLPDFLKKLGKIWRIQIVSTNSGAAMRRLVADANVGLGFNGAVNSTQNVKNGLLK